MVFKQLFTVSVALLMGVFISITPSLAQTDAPSVLILPIDQAQFLPGAHFDFRVEVHAPELPENFAVTINGTPAADFLKAEATQENWTFGDEATHVSSVIWRNLTAPKPGDYTVQVTAGNTTESVTWTVRTPVVGAAKNVIVFIADGMTISQITAARAARGMKEGLPTHELAMDGFKIIGLASTSSVDTLMADSANTASAINTGHIGSLNATGTYSDTSPSTLDDPRVETFAEMVKRTRNMAVGIVTTAELSDATPAAVWAHGRDRNDDNRADYLVQALAFGPDVLMGGGSRRMLPGTFEDSRRSDDRDLFAEYKAAGYTIVTTKTEMDTAFEGDAAPKKVLGVFNPNNLDVWLDRNIYTDNLGDFTDQPGLVDMTLSALEVVNQNPNGFYLEVEAASVDKQLHALDQERALSDLIEFDQAVAAAEAWVAKNAPDTLIVVTADHAHGYEVYGVVDVEGFNEATNDTERRDSIMDYYYPNYPDANGDGFPEWQDATLTMAGVMNNHPDYTEDFQVSKTPRVPAIVDENGIVVDNPEDDPNGIPMSGDLPVTVTVDNHTVQDVPVFAAGPGAEALMGTYHQREIFFALAGAIGLDPSAKDGVAR